jgi:hypothetical protein
VAVHGQQAGTAVVAIVPRPFQGKVLATQAREALSIGGDRELLHPRRSSFRSGYSSCRQGKVRPPVSGLGFPNHQADLGKGQSIDQAPVHPALRIATGIVAGRLGLSPTGGPPPASRDPRRHAAAVPAPRHAARYGPAP